MHEMVIDLFNKGDGLSCLKKIYQLDDKQLQNIEDRVFEYDTPPKTQEEIDEFIATIASLPGETEESARTTAAHLFDRNRMKRWPVDDCVKVFLEETGIKPNIYDVSEVKVRCKHVTAQIDGGESMRMYGLLKLTDMLEEDTPLSRFLKENGIAVNPSEYILTVGNETIMIPERSNGNQIGVLSSKLYYDKGEIEVFISGEDERIVDYSCVKRCPEILQTLDTFIGGYDCTRLQEAWEDRKTDLMIVQFDLGLDELIIHSMPNRMNDMEKYWELEEFLSKEYEREKIPDRFWQNYWIILNCLDNATTYFDRQELYAAVKPNVLIDPERITLHSI